MNPIHRGASRVLASRVMIWRPGKVYSIEMASANKVKMLEAARELLRQL
jgi:hypothetical protein